MSSVPVCLSVCLSFLLPILPTHPYLVEQPSWARLSLPNLFELHLWKIKNTYDEVEIINKAKRSYLGGNFYTQIIYIYAAWESTTLYIPVNQILDQGPGLGTQGNVLWARTWFHWERHCSLGENEIQMLLFTGSCIFDGLIRMPFHILNILYLFWNKMVSDVPQKCVRLNSSLRLEFITWKFGH